MSCLYQIAFLDAWPNQPNKVTAPGSQTSATLQNLRPSQIYHVRILAENRLGLSDPSQIIQISTLEEGKRKRQQCRL